MIAFEETNSGIAVPTRLRTQVIPWEALNALSPPVNAPQVSSDILSTFAVMVAKGPRAPALVGTDEHSKLLTAAEINQFTTIGRANVIGDSSIMVSDPTYAGAGSVLVIFSTALLSFHGPYQVSGAGQDADGTIHLVQTLTQNVAVGDGVRRLPIVGLSSLLNTVQIGNPLPLGVSLVPADFDIQSAVATALAGPATNIVQTITFAAAANQRFYLKYLLSTIFGNGAATVALSVIVHDGTSGASTQLLRYDHGSIASGATDRQYLNKPTCRTSVGNGMLIEFNNTSANTQQTIAAGGYYL